MVRTRYSASIRSTSPPWTAASRATIASRCSGATRSGQVETKSSVATPGPPSIALRRALMWTRPAETSQSQKPSEPPSRTWASCARLARISASRIRAAVTSANVATAPLTFPSTPRRGSARTLIHRTPSPGTETPMGTSHCGTPVRSTTCAGCSEPGNGLPSSWMVRQAGSVGVLPQNLVGREPQDPLGGRVGGHDGAVRGVDHDPLGHRGDDGLVPPLAGPQGILGPLALGDVDHRDPDLRTGMPQVAPPRRGRGDELHEAGAPLSVTQGHLAGVRPGPGEGVADERGAGGPVARPHVGGEPRPDGLVPGAPENGGSGQVDAVDHAGVVQGGVADRRVIVEIGELLANHLELLVGVAQQLGLLGERIHRAIRRLPGRGGRRRVDGGWRARGGARAARPARSLRCALLRCHGGPPASRSATASGYCPAPGMRRTLVATLAGPPVRLTVRHSRIRTTEFRIRDRVEGRIAGPSSEVDHRLSGCVATPPRHAYPANPRPFRLVRGLLPFRRSPWRSHDSPFVSSPPRPAGLSPRPGDCARRPGPVSRRGPRLPAARLLRDARPLAQVAA